VMSPMADKYITETTTKLKPDGSTYREWCMKTRAMINQQKLGKYLKKVRMEDGQYPSGYNEEDDLCALAHIQQSIHADHLKFVKDTATTYETWESLKAIYESVSEVNLVTLQLQMSKLEWGERNGLDSFADQFNESMSKIAVAGDSTPDKAHLTRFLCLLPPCFAKKLCISHEKDVPERHTTPWFPCWPNSNWTTSDKDSMIQTWPSARAKWMKP
ncbi:unnamed protein product, partial [Aphanomyces euteiches]